MPRRGVRRLKAGALDPRTPAQIEKYLADALKVIRQEALYSTRMDWDTIQEQARECAAQSRSYAGTHRLLYRVLKEAGGDHSHMALPYQFPDAARRMAGGGAGTLPASNSADPPLPEGRLIEGAAYLTLPTLSRRSGGLRLARRYIAAGSRVVDELAAARPHGWIVDLRENTGGSIWPMIAALAGLLEPGVLGRFLLPDGRSQAWHLRRGRLTAPVTGHVSLDRRPMARIHSRGQRRGDAPLAALISSRTASAGEAALIALRAQSPSRTFGGPTAGMTTGNITRFLPDGTRLMISMSHYADAEGRLISGAIQPDVVVDGDGDSDGEGDGTLKQALDWLGG